MSTLRLLFAALCCAGLLTSGARAQQRPVYAQPLSAAEARLLRAEIRRQARRADVPDPTLSTIAARLQVSPANTNFRTLIALVREKADEIAVLRKQFASLQRQLAELRDPAIRNPAEAAVARANKAIAEGRLADADRELEALEALRRGESEQATKAWVSGVEARAALAALQLDFDKSATILIAAADAERLHSALRQWRLLLGAGETLYDKAGRFRDRPALVRSLDLYRHRVLPLVLKGVHPEEWAQTQMALAIALMRLSDADSDKAVLEESAEIIRSTFEVYLRDKNPKGWAMAQMNLAVAVGALGAKYDMPGGTDEAIAAYRRALEVYTRAEYPLEWSVIQGNIAIELATTGSETRVIQDDFDPLDESVAIFRDILTVITRDFDAQAWASVQRNLAVTLSRRGWRHNGTKDLIEAAALMRAALSVTDRAQEPFHWADSQNSLGSTIENIGQRDRSLEILNEAIAVHRAALGVFTRSDHPADWAKTMRLMSDAMRSRARLTRTCADARSAESLIAEARVVDGSRIETNGQPDNERDEAERLTKELCN